MMEGTKVGAGAGGYLLRLMAVCAVVGMMFVAAAVAGVLVCALGCFSDVDDGKNDGDYVTPSSTDYVATSVSSSSSDYVATSASSSSTSTRSSVTSINTSSPACALSGVPCADVASEGCCEGGCKPHPEPQCTSELGPVCC